MKKALSYTLIFIGLQMVITPLVVFIVPLIIGEKASNMNLLALIGMGLFAVVTTALFFRCGWTKASRSFLMSRPWAILFWCVLAAIGIIIPATAFLELLSELPNWIESGMAELIRLPGSYFVVCILAPLAEEVVFRGAILRALLAWKPDREWGMIAISALLFSAIHMNPAQMPHAFIVGLLLGWLYSRTGSIVPGVVFHCVNNTIAYLMTRLYPSEDLRLIDILGSERQVLMAVGFSLLILLPSLYQLYLSLRRR